MSSEPKPQPPITLDDGVTAVVGLGTKHAKVLRESFGITTVRGLVEHYPHRYQDLGSLTDLSAVEVGEPATLVGTIVGWDTRVIPKGRRSLRIAAGSVRTETGGIFEITFFNQPWQPAKLPPGTLAAFSGKIERFRSSLKITQPQVNSLGRGHAAAGAFDRIDHRQLLPVYPGTGDVPGFRIAGWIEQVLDVLPPFADHLDESFLDQQDLLTRDDAVRGIHLPPDRDTHRAARARLVFDELLQLQIALQARRARLEAELAGITNTPRHDGQAMAFLDALPFAATGAQERAFDAIGDDLGAEAPMHRLLQGDVGSGKTLVAIWAMLSAVDNGRQAALMVPTEVLAEQHARTLTEQLAPLGVNVLDGIRTALLTGSTPLKARRRILAELFTGEIDLVVGTHALLEDPVQFADLGLVVIDEQHRFGVSQRVQLKDKRRPAAGDTRESLPDVLVMTATPIPRSLALTVYGDLDVTVLDELPPGRQPIVTQLIGPDEQEARRPRLEEFIHEQALAGQQTYVVCPLVDESEAIEARSAVEEHARLSRRFPDLEVALVHGQLASEDKELAMGRFRTGQASILVATTVIEVGVDVPSATVMVIENAERFGISQLHQLRGRVGRGTGKSYCVLFAGTATEDGERRLEAVAATTDGFILADVDLEVRGEGQLFGQRQSGLPDLKIARLRRDLAVISDTRDMATDLVRRNAVPPALWAETQRRFGDWLDDDLQTG